MFILSLEVKVDPYSEGGCETRKMPKYSRAEILIVVSMFYVNKWGF